LVLFQTLQDEVERSRSQARAAEKKLQRRELETHEQVWGCPWAGSCDGERQDLASKQKHIFSCKIFS